jgi:hypothetical protein
VLRIVTTERKGPARKARQPHELPLDPDVIARHLTGEDPITEPPELSSQPAPRPTLAVIAACVALAIFLVSIWIALR